MSLSRSMWDMELYVVNRDILDGRAGEGSGSPRKGIMMAGSSTGPPPRFPLSSSTSILFNEIRRKPNAYLIYGITELDLFVSLDQVGSDQIEDFLGWMEIILGSQPLTRVAWGLGVKKWR